MGTKKKSRRLTIAVVAEAVDELPNIPLLSIHYLLEEIQEGDQVQNAIIGKP